MNDPIISPPIADPSALILPLGNRPHIPTSSTDSEMNVTRGVGNYIKKYFPHLLKNNFNKVLLVDEDPAVQTSLGSILTTSGYIVQHAVSDAETLQIVNDNSPDFLIIEWKKPNRSCLKICETLRHQFANKVLYIIVIATSGPVRDKVQAISAGADAFMVKPIAAGEILSQLQAGIRIIEQQLQMKELAMHDPLTGLLNRRLFSELKEQVWNRAERHKHPLSCAMIDVDYFKNINDSFGHLHGDRVLTRISELLTSIGRKSDILCRYGGEEFCMLMPDTNLQGAMICAERFRKIVAGEKETSTEEAAFPTVTVGVATKIEAMENSNAIIEIADKALIWGKLKSRNIVATYDNATSDFVPFKKFFGLGT